MYDEDAQPKDRAEEHDDVPRSLFAEHQRSVQPNDENEHGPKSRDPAGEIPRMMSYTQWVAKKRIESIEVMVNVTLCFISRFPVEFAFSRAFNGLRFVCWPLPVARVLLA